MLCSFKITAAIALLAASSSLAQTCSPTFTEGTAYDVKSNIDDSYIWVFNGASHGTLSAVYLEQSPTGLEPWYLTSTATGGWTISVDSPAVTCVLAPADTLLTTGSCTGSATEAELDISCLSCDNGTAQGCTIVSAATSECINVPGDSNGDPSIRSAECTGSPQQLWDIVAVDSE